MKRAMLFISLVAVLALSMLACSLVTINPTGREVVRGSGDIISEARPVRGVKAVQLRTLGTLHIEFGDQEKLEYRPHPLLPDCQRNQRVEHLLQRRH